MKVLKDQRGFTIIELVLSFVFVFTIAFSMYQLVFNYKEKRDQEAIYATMIDYKNEITLAIHRDMNDRVLKNIEYCTSNSELIPRCLVIYFNDGTSKQLSVETETIEYDGEPVETEYIKYGNINYKNDEALLLEFKANYMLYKEDISNGNGKKFLYKIYVPIYHNDLGDEDFGLNIIAVGYNDNSSTSGSGSNVAPVWSTLGRTFRSANKNKCTTQTFAHNDVATQTMIVRFKLDDISSAMGSHIISNMNNNGSTIYISSTAKLCYGAYIITPESDKPVLKSVCLNNVLDDGSWITVVAGFKDKGTGADMSVYTIDQHGNTDSKTVDVCPGLSGCKVTGSHVNYSIGVEPGKAINLAYFDGTIQDIAVYNNGKAPGSDYVNLGSGVITSKIETVYGTTGKVFHYDFKDNSIYATYCME